MAIINQMRALELEDKRESDAQNINFCQWTFNLLSFYAETENFED